jgi:SAM-dependent methyltransferase
MAYLAVHRQYNDVVAPYYDLDPQELTGRSLSRAIQQLTDQRFLEGRTGRPRVFDVGMGTGLFLDKLKALSRGRIQPFGIDLAEKMVENARRKIPDLIAEVRDAARLGDCFPGQSFDLVCTHFVTGFVPMSVLAPQIRDRLDEGGCWSLVGGTKAGFPVLQAASRNRILRSLCAASAPQLDDVLLNPADQGEVVATMQANGFEVLEAETFEPALEFPDFDAFMEFAYRGGWFTPIVEAAGLHKAGALTRWLLNRLVFPVKDHHSIVIALARKAR